MKEKICNRKHKSAITKHCVNCGELTGADVTPNPNCLSHHAEYATWENHNFCPDCGEKL